MLRFLKYLIYLSIILVIMLFIYAKIGDMSPPKSNNEKILILKNEN